MPQNQREDSVAVHEVAVAVQGANAVRVTRQPLRLRRLFVAFQCCIVASMFFGLVPGICLQNRDALITYRIYVRSRRTSSDTR